MLSAGEEKVLRKLYQKYVDRVYRYLMGLSGGDEKVSEDICQEVWVSLAARIRELMKWSDPQILTWLRLTARAKYRRYRKKQAERQEVPLEEYMEDEKLCEDSLEELVLFEVLCREKFGELSDMEKELVRCKLYGLSYRKRHPGERRSENALAIRCSRAFCKWRRRLGEDGLGYS